MELLYKGKNIYPDVKLKECVYDSRCDNHLSHLRIVFQDDDHSFDSYGISKGDEIQLKDGYVDTKKMYINEIKPVNAEYEIVANPVKKEVMQESDTKQWKSVKFKKVMCDIAQKHNMTVQFFGVSDNKYKKIEQNNEKDIQFAARMAMLEGCIIVIFDGKMIVASREYMERQNEEKTFEIDDYDVTLKKASKYRKCEVKGEKISGKYERKDGVGTLTYKIEISTKEEGNRFAKNLLTFKNEKAQTGIVVTDEVMDGYSGGTIVKVSSKDHPCVNGNVCITRVRHDLVNGKSKIWFRCLED